MPHDDASLTDAIRSLRDGIDYGGRGVGRVASWPSPSGQEGHGFGTKAPQAAALPRCPTERTIAELIEARRRARLNRS